LVKTGTERSEKYDAKYDAEVVRSRFSNTATLAKAKAATRQEKMSTIAGLVRGFLNEAGTYPILTVLYQSFANALYKICADFGNYDTTPVYTLAGRNVALLKIAQWKDMGAVDALLQDIWGIFEACLGNAPSPVP